MQYLHCSPEQGKHIRGDTLRVCLSTCQGLFRRCCGTGSSLKNFPSWGDFCEDPITLCEKAWGGFGYSSPCDGYPDSALCKSGVLNLEVVDDSVDNDGCLAAVSRWSEGGRYSQCEPFSYGSSPSSSGSSSGSVPIILIAFIVGGVLTGFRYYMKRRRANENQSAGGNAGFSSTPPSSSVPVASATPVANAVAVPVGSAPPQSAVASTKPATAPSAPPASAVTPATQLTFDQQMEIQSLEFKLRMEMIAQEEFDEMKKDILSV